MKPFRLLTILSSLVLISSCAATLLPVSVQQNSTLDGYKYVYITPTSGITSTTGGVYGGSYGVYGSTQTKSIYPSDIIYINKTTPKVFIFWGCSLSIRIDSKINP